MQETAGREPGLDDFPGGGIDMEIAESPSEGLQQAVVRNCLECLAKIVDGNVAQTACGEPVGDCRG